MAVDMKQAVKAAIQSTLALASGFERGGVRADSAFAEFGLAAVIEATAMAGLVISVGFIGQENIVGTFGEPGPVAEPEPVAGGSSSMAGSE